LKVNIENRGENPTPENVKAILKEIERNFGTYSHPKDTRSRKDLDAIPKFTNSQSVLDGIDKIKLLNEERTQWEKIENKPKNFYAYGDHTLKCVLIKLMRECNPLQYVLNNFQINIDNITFSEMCNTLTIQAIKSLRPSELEQEEAEKQKCREIWGKSKALVTQFQRQQFMNHTMFKNTKTMKL
jgi:hypothetical protein